MTQAVGPKTYFGKYKGTVLVNVDPELRGRIICKVPDVLGLVPSSWCEACVPLAGPAPMGIYVVPPIGAGVWVEFEQGNPDYPIWVGGWWGSAAEVPPQPERTTAVSKSSARSPKAFFHARAQRRKDSRKECHLEPGRLCVFAPLREKSSLIR